MKSALTGDAVLISPNFNLPFQLQMDASVRGIGAVLSQNIDQDTERPVAYFSKKLNKAQINYTATEKECLAVVKGIDHFAVYLLGRKFLLQTDHKGLQQMKTMDNRIQRLMRWALTLQPYNFDIQYRPGRELKKCRCFVSTRLSRAFAWGRRGRCQGRAFPDRATGPRRQQGNVDWELMDCIKC